MKDMTNNTEIQSSNPFTVKILCCETPIKRFYDGKMFCTKCLKIYTLINQLF